MIWPWTRIKQLEWKLSLKEEALRIVTRAYLKKVVEHEREHATIMQARHADRIRISAIESQLAAVTKERDAKEQQSQRIFDRLVEVESERNALKAKVEQMECDFLEAQGLEEDLFRLRKRLDVAESERDALKAKVEELEQDLRDSTWQDHADHWQKRCLAAESQVTALRSALEKYGEHAGRCNVTLGYDSPCSCGWAESQALLSASPPPEGKGLVTWDVGSSVTCVMAPPDDSSAPPAEGRGADVWREEEQEQCEMTVPLATRCLLHAGHVGPHEASGEPIPELPDFLASPVETDQIKRMVDRFLGWRLPEDFSPDAGISFKATHSEGTPYAARHTPIGTNLLNATQAEAMVRHMLGLSPEGGQV